jgi:hypothetical protein
MVVWKKRSKSRYILHYGTIMASEQYFLGDTWEKVKCSACKIVLAVDSADLDEEK